MAIKKVSVIVPMHNGERFISRCIESILNQSYKKIELIIVAVSYTHLTLPTIA